MGRIYDNYHSKRIICTIIVKNANPVKNLLNAVCEKILLQIKRY